MFTVFFAFVLMTYAYAAEEIPSYIHVCGRKNPDYAQCFKDNINNLNYKACTGMPEFNISPIEPVTIDEIVVYNTDNLKLYLKDLKIKGFCDFVVNSLNVSPDKLHFDFDFAFNHLNVDSLYDFDIHLLVSLANKGLIHITADNVDGKLAIDFKEVTKNDKTQIYVSRANTNLNIKTFKYEFDESEKDQMSQLYEALRNTLNENQQDIINIATPVLEKKFSEIVISAVNNVTYNRYEQLFPDEA